MMRFMGSMMVAVVLVLTCSAGTQATGDQHVWLPVKVYHGYLVVAEGSIGNMPKRHLLIDTAAYPSVVDREVAQALRLNITSDKLRLIGGNVPGASAIIPGVQLGPIAAPAMRVEVQDLRGVSKRIGTRVDALIGLDVLARSNFRIDYVAHELVFGPVGVLEASAPLRQVDSMNCVDMQIDGHLLRLLVASAAYGITVTSEQAKPFQTSSSRQRESAGLGGTMTLWQVHANQLMLGGVSLGAGDFLISNTAEYKHLPFDGLFAPGALGFEQVAFDFERQTFSWQKLTPRRNKSTSARDNGSTPNGSTAFTNPSLARDLTTRCDTMDGTSECVETIRTPATR